MGTKISVLGLTLSIGVLFVNILQVDENAPSYAAFYAVTVSLVGCLLFQSNWNIWLCANFLGYCFAAGVMLAYISEIYCSLGCYIALMSTFHYMEFLTTALTNPANLSVDSYLLNHSVPYGLAALASWVEYALEYWAFGAMTTSIYLRISSFGVIICIIGDCIRKLAMFHAGRSFNHIVQGTKAKE